MKKMLVIAALLGICTAGFAAEQPSNEAELQRLIQAVEKAGFKVTPAAEQDKAAEAADTQAAEEMLKKLEAPIVSVEYKEAPLAEVLAELQKVTGVNMLLDPKVAQARAGTGQVTMKLDKVKPISVLQNALKLYDLVAIYADEALLVTLPTEEEPLTLMYDVHELTVVRDFSHPLRRVQRSMRGVRISGIYWMREAEKQEEEDAKAEEKPRYDPDALIKLVKQATPNGDWNSDVYSVTHVNGVLVVTQRASVQIEVVNFLTALKTRM
ncbi:MAG TPA: hypothetical protein VM141_10100 [Planctomycetota bacterium]|nr:hypothetical protein [Planctomycetota bacterium]